MFSFLFACMHGCHLHTHTNTQSLVSKFHRAHQNHMNYAVCGPASGLRHADGSLTHDSEFIIRHYAGPIIYETAGFVDKNKDAMYDHLYDVVSRSSSPLLSALCPPRSFSGASGGILNMSSMTNSMSGHGSSLGSPAGAMTPSKASGQTVATRFTASLHELTEVLARTQTRFVRCVKTNGLLKPQIFDKPSVLRQLKTSGVMSALEIRRAGYPTRLLYKDFVNQFRVFDVSKGPHEHARLPSMGNPSSPRNAAAAKGHKAIAARMMTHPEAMAAVTQEQYRLGVTKIFFQADVLIALQTVKDRILLPYAVKIQKWWLRKQERIWEHKLVRCVLCVYT